MSFEYSPEGARRAASTHQLAAWVDAFLRGPGGNLGMADGLRLAPRSWFGPLTWPLAEVTRCCGPEVGMPYPVPRDEFEWRVTGLGQSLAGGWTAPPLLVNFSEGRLSLNDGNHRHEALVRRGQTCAPMLFWTTGDEDRRAFEELFGPWLAIEALWQEGLSLGREGVIGCLVRRDDRVFAQRRSPDRKLFPGCWDLAGGHLEPGEGPRFALARELFEETGWGLGRLLGLRKVVDWESHDASGGLRLKREFVLAVEATGDLDHPRLEAGKATEGRWFTVEDLPLLNENRDGTDTYVYDLVSQELGR